MNEQQFECCMDNLRRSLEHNSRKWGGGHRIDMDSIREISQVVTRKRSTDIQEREVEVRYSYYVVSGLLRFYYLTESGKELNKCFYREGDFASDFASFYLRQPSRFSIATIEPSVLVRIAYRDLEGVLERSPELRFLSEQAMNTLMIRNERREEDFLTLSAGERFRKFVSNFPDYMDRIPQRHIASYLGITPESLSKYKTQWLSSENE